jgi:hypothetical protein
MKKGHWARWAGACTLVMFHVPKVAGASWGANLPGSPQRVAAALSGGPPAARAAGPVCPRLDPAGFVRYGVVCVAQHDEFAWIGGQGTEP